MKPINEIEDYKEASEILNSEYSALGWNETRIHGGQRIKDDTGWEHFAFQIEFRAPCKESVFLAWKNGVAYVTGPKWNQRPKLPNPAEVLAAHCRDYRESAHTSFGDWCCELGYDQDSRKAFRIYEDCQQIGTKLHSLGLSRAQIERFADLSSML